MDDLSFCAEASVIGLSSVLKVRGSRALHDWRPCVGWVVFASRSLLKSLKTKSDDVFCRLGVSQTATEQHRRHTRQEAGAVADFALMACLTPRENCDTYSFLFSRQGL